MKELNSSLSLTEDTDTSDFANVYDTFRRMISKIQKVHERTRGTIMDCYGNIVWQEDEAVYKERLARLESADEQLLRGSVDKVLKGEMSFKELYEIRDKMIDGLIYAKVLEIVKNQLDSSLSNH